MTLFALHFQLDKKIFIHCYFLLVLMPEPALYIWQRCQFCIWYSLAAFRFPFVICRSRSVAISENLNEQFLKNTNHEFWRGFVRHTSPLPVPFLRLTRGKASARGTIDGGDWVFVSLHSPSQSKGPCSILSSCKFFRSTTVHETFGGLRTQWGEYFSHLM